MDRKNNSFLAVIIAWAFLLTGKAQAITMGNIQLWTGSGTNQAALVIEWSVPISLTNSTVPVPVADKTLVWGYRFNGMANGTQMLKAILTTDPKLYVVANETNSTSIEGIGYNLNGNGMIGITDGTSTNDITNGTLTNATVNMDAAYAINSGDLYWGGVNGPKWELWTETNDAGGFFSSPNRGTNIYWTATDTNFTTGYHGQWEYAQTNLDHLFLTNGSWIGFSVSAGEPEPATNAAYSLDKHAPVSPDGTYVAYIVNTNDFATSVVCTNDVDATYPYNDPLAVLGSPTLKFIDHIMPHQVSIIHRTKIVEPPYWTDPNTNPVITQIDVGGQITVNMGRKIYDDPNNPYGMDFIVYGNSFYQAAGFGTEIDDFTDEGVVTIPGGTPATYGHPTVVSVSQDGTNWYTYPYVPFIIPDNAYRWDDTSHVWTDEEMNETKPLDPSLNLAPGITVANALDEYAGSCGGTGYDLKPSGFPWIQYVRVTAGTNATDTNAFDYTVIDAIGAVNPVPVGDALSIMPGDLALGYTSLVFQQPDDLSQTLISIDFDSVSTNARISTVSLHEFSSFAPVIGTVSSAYQIQSLAIEGTNAVVLQADVGLRAGENYSGNGSDLRVFQWQGTNRISQPFTFNPTNDEVLVSGVTNFSAFVVSQIAPPQLSIQSVTNGYAFQFTPVPDCANILERSPDLMIWTRISTNTPASAQPMVLQDTNAPVGKAFYRVLVNVP
jgi:hypothetical protein